MTLVVCVIPERAKFCAESAKFSEPYRRYFNFQKNVETPNGNLGRFFPKIYRIEEAPGPMLTGIELFQHRFSGNPENH